MFDMRKIQEQVIYDAVLKRSNGATAEEVVFGTEGNARSESNPEWVKLTMGRLESSFDKEAVKQIRMDCQCGYGMDDKLKFVKELLDAAPSPKEFANNERAAAAGLFYDGGVLYLQFPFCPCPMLAEVDRLETNAWCQCTTGYSKVLFEKAFGCTVEVELLKSIKMGDDRCLMKIMPQGAAWE